eukprot:1159751-Pelagomonas_calceolata.AAC.4
MHMHMHMRAHASFPNVDKITKKIKKAKDPDTKQHLEGRLFRFLQLTAQKQEQEDPSPQPPAQQQPRFELPQQQPQQVPVGITSTAEEVARRKLRAQRFASNVDAEEREDEVGCRAEGSSTTQASLCAHPLASPKCKSFDTD